LAAVSPPKMVSLSGDALNELGEASNLLEGMCDVEEKLVRFLGSD